MDLRLIYVAFSSQASHRPSGWSPPNEVPCFLSRLQSAAHTFQEAALQPRVSNLSIFACSLLFLFVVLGFFVAYAFCSVSHRTNVLSACLPALLFFCLAVCLACCLSI